MSELREKLTAEFTVYKILVARLDNQTEIYEKRYDKALNVQNFHFESADFTIPFIYSGLSPDLTTIFYTAVLIESDGMEGQEYLSQLKKEIEHEGWQYVKTEQTSKRDLAEMKSYAN
jgi:hypothetical protein